MRRLCSFFGKTEEKSTNLKKTIAKLYFKNLVKRASQQLNMKKHLLLIACLSLFSQCEAPPQEELKTGFDWQGHRGCRGLMPENTIPGFIEALKYPIKTLELDVVVAKDNEVIISHEPWMLAAICSFPDGQRVEASQEDSLLLYNLTYEEIKQFDCGKRGNADFPEQKPMPAYKPSLEDAVIAIEEYCHTKGRALPIYNIEVKSKVKWDGVKIPGPELMARLVIDQIAELDIQDRAYIQSFDLRILRAVRQIDSTVATALLVANAKGIDGNIKELGYIPATYSPHYAFVTHNVVERVHELGMMLVPWTINDSLVMKQMIQMGVDGIITDYPNYIEQVESTLE